MHSGDPIISNFEGLEIQNESKSMGRVQRVEEKNRVICLFIMFNPGVMVIKMSKTADFFDLLLMIAKKKKKKKKKKIVSLGKIFTCTWKIISSSFRTSHG